MTAFEGGGIEQKLLPASPGRGDVNGRPDAQFSDFAIKHHLHIPGSLEFLKNQIVHAASGFNQGRSDDREASRFLGVACG